MTRSLLLFLLVPPAGLAGTIMAVPAAAETAEDRMSIHEYNPALRMAVQQRLKDRGFYKGRIDGNIGPATRAALASLTGWPRDSKFRLGHELVEKLFGLEGYGIYDLAKDEAELLEAIKAQPISRYKPLEWPPR